VLLIGLLLVPLVTGGLCRMTRRLGLMEALNVAGAGGTLALAAVVVVRVARDGEQRALRDVLYVDALSAVMIATIAGVGCAAALASVGYLRHDLERRHVPGGRRGAGWYYLGLHVFIGSMLATVSVANLGLLWVGIEATTLASALLVGFYRTRAALEAAWKYLILCTVGITFALFGVLLTYYAAQQSGAAGATGLDWTTLRDQAALLDPAMMRLAFVFVLVGFGTKAGFAPMHTWLADAHSQAPSPISGVLSGVLLSCAVYGILRFHVITVGSAGEAFSSRLLLAFGVFSVLVAVPFIILQRDLKRLLAYSSVEHIGLMAVAFGIGGPLGVYAGVLHMVNHAATKALLFFVTGNLVQRFGTRRIGALRGALRAAPYLSWALLLGVLAITGLPPFSVFVSELAIANAGFRGDRWELAAVVAVVLLLGLLFAGLLAHALRIAYGQAGDGARAHPTPPVRRDWLALASIAPLAAVMLLLGVHVPHDVSTLFSDVAAILSPTPGVASR
jgi:hydrogenase-4 component F